MASTEVHSLRIWKRKKIIDCIYCISGLVENVRDIKSHILWKIK